MQDQNQPTDEPKRFRWLRGWRLAVLITCLFLAIPVLSLLVVIFVVQPVKVEGHAMLPTFRSGDKILLSKQINKLERGDIVAFYYPLDKRKSFIKRIVGLPGETISIDEYGQLTINNAPVDEPYVSPDRHQHPRSFTKTIEADHYFVMGDNRDASNDSRSFGTVPRSLIYGKYMFLYEEASP